MKNNLSKIFIAMSLRLILLGIYFFSQITFATRAEAQNIEDVFLTIQIKDKPVEEIFQIIEDQTKFTFFYGNEFAPTRKKKISLKVNHKSLKFILGEISQKTNLNFKQINNTIAIGKSNPKTDNSKNRSDNTKEYQFQVQGNVQDREGNPIPGVNIHVKGTALGTTTDFDGNYTIEANSESGTLVFSYIGFTSKEIAISGQNQVNVTLSEDVTSLDEIVVIGYGTQKKSDLTGAVSSVKTEEIQNTPITSVDQGLVGRASGVLVTQTSGMPGATASIRIRGSSSLQGGNEPLYVIDGFPVYSGSGTGNSGGNASMSGLSTINPSDIASIEILKDASATSIYGARAANGVVLITTKSGKKGEDRISFQTSSGLQSVVKKIDVLNAYDYAQLVNEAYTNDGLSPFYDNATIERLRANPEGTDWQDELFRPALTQNYQMTFSGGDEKTIYMVSGSYLNQEGIIQNSDFKRYSGRINLERTVSDNFKLGTHLTLSKTSSNAVQTDSGGNTGVVTAAMKFNPIAPVYSDPETGTYTLVNEPGIVFPNPIATAKETQRENKFTRVLGNIYGEWEIIPNLKAKVSFGFDLSTTKYSNYIPSTLYESNGVAIARISEHSTRNWLNENTLSWSKQLNDDHHLSLLGGITFQRNDSDGVMASAQGFINDLLESNSLESGSIYNQPSSDLTEWSLLSYLARANYNFKDKYLFSLSSRIDGSSRFGKNNKYALFPSGSFAWRISNESFMENSQAVSNLKLRTSYGITGNQEIGLYNSLPIMTNSTYTFGRSLATGIYPQIIPNPDLKWERTSQFNIGIDLGLFKNRISITSDFYHKKTTDLIYDVAIPYTSGFTSSLQNIGSMENQGIEFSLNSRNFTGDFSWTTAFNISFNKNKVLDLGGESYKDVGGGDGHLKTGAVHRLIVGKPIGLFYGYEFDGIFQNQTEVDQGPNGPTNYPGGRRYVDQNGDGQINATEDRTVIGDPNPEFYGGFTNTFAYKGFEMNVFMQYSYGGDLFNYNSLELELPTGGQNVYQEMVNRWTPENPSNKYPRATTNRSAIFSDAYIEDASYLKIKTITLAYTFPELESNLIKGLKVYATGQNLFTFTDYRGYDPEVSYRGASNLEIGEDFGGYPQTKTFLLGVNVDIQ